MFYSGETLIKIVMIRSSKPVHYWTTSPYCLQETKQRLGRGVSTSQGGKRHELVSQGPSMQKAPSSSSLMTHCQRLMLTLVNIYSRTRLLVTSVQKRQGCWSPIISIFCIDVIRLSYWREGRSSIMESIPTSLSKALTLLEQ